MVAGKRNRGKQKRREVVDAERMDNQSARSTVFEFLLSLSHDMMTHYPSVGSVSRSLVLAGLSKNSQEQQSAKMEVEEIITPHSDEEALRLEQRFAKAVEVLQSLGPEEHTMVPTNDEKLAVWSPTFWFDARRTSC